MQTLMALIWLPWLTAMIVLLVPSLRWSRGIAIVLTLLLSIASGLLLMPPDSLTYQLPHLVERGILFGDMVLLLFFAYQGWRHRAKKVGILAVAQLLLFVGVEMMAPASMGMSIMVDGVSKLMFFIINMVGGVIIIYAVTYLKYEKMSAFKKRLFLAYLMLFLSVMNAIVIANSLLLFFFLFELTTLASYLLIAFRQDATAQANALRALWMNQLGGVMILFAAFVALGAFDTLLLSDLLRHSGGWIPVAVALLSMAVLIKGASLPFDGWLLGAMVAPTPVSAMLHSATMVKIAPFMILKLAPVLGMTALGHGVAIFGALVFVVASFLGLSRGVFKEVLGYSTIALLGLMVSLAAVGTPESMMVAQILILFHAVSKALLFLSAGVLEKVYDVKHVEQMEGLAYRAPESVRYIIFGFVSMTLPPFGLLVGKVLAITSVASQLQAEPILLVVLLGIIVGSALLVLLYFKVASALLAYPSDLEPFPSHPLELGFAVPLMVLSGMILCAGLGLLVLQGIGILWLMMVSLVVMAGVPWLLRAMSRFDRVRPYQCGETAPFTPALNYFDIPMARRRQIYWFFGVLWVSLLLIGVGL